MGDVVGWVVRWLRVLTLFTGRSEPVLTGTVRSGRSERADISVSVAETERMMTGAVSFSLVAGSGAIAPWVHMDGVIQVHHQLFFPSVVPFCPPPSLSINSASSSLFLASSKLISFHSSSTIAHVLFHSARQLSIPSPCIAASALTRALYCIAGPGRTRTSSATPPWPATSPST